MGKMLQVSKYIFKKTDILHNIFFHNNALNMPETSQDKPIFLYCS